MKRNPLVYIYILLLSIAFTNRYGDYRVPYFFSALISLIIVFLGILTFLSDVNKEKKTVIKMILKTYFFPIVLLHIYSLLMTVLGFFDKEFLSTNMITYYPVLLATSSYQLFGKKTIKYSIIAMIISWLLSAIGSVLMKGIYIFPYAIMQAYFGFTGSYHGISYNYLELHDLMLSLGLVLIYYIYTCKKLTRRHFFMIITVIAFMMLGMKRISVLGIFVVCFFMFFNKSRKKNKAIKSFRMVSIGIIIVSFLFLYLLFDNSLLILLMEKLNINLMGRNYYYNAIIDYGDFGINFLGLGRNAVAKLFQTDLSYLKVGGVHSDILKMYIENGFFMFLWWLSYYLIRVPKIYLNKFGFKSMSLYCYLIIYTFILYFTDNVENYLIYQYMLIMIPICFSVENLRKRGC